MCTPANPQGKLWKQSSPVRHTLAPDRTASLQGHAQGSSPQQRHTRTARRNALHQHARHKVSISMPNPTLHGPTQPATMKRSAKEAECVLRSTKRSHADHRNPACAATCRAAGVLGYATASRTRLHSLAGPVTLKGACGPACAARTGTCRGWGHIGLPTRKENHNQTQAPLMPAGVPV